MELLRRKLLEAGIFCANILWRFLYNLKCGRWKLKMLKSTIRLLTGRLVKILLIREVSTMRSNTQNKN